MRSLWFHTKCCEAETHGQNHTILYLRLCFKFLQVKFIRDQSSLNPKYKLLIFFFFPIESLRLFRNKVYSYTKIHNSDLWMIYLFILGGIKCVTYYCLYTTCICGYKKALCSCELKETVWFFLFLKLLLSDDHQILNYTELYRFMWNITGW